MSNPDENSADRAKYSLELFLDSIVENIPHMIFVKDAEELRFVRFNQAGEELLGFSREELIGKNDYDFFPKEQANFFTEKDREVLRGRTLVDIPEEPIHTKRGLRVLHTKKIPILNEIGEPTFLLGISEDITERKAAEARLAEAERLASIGTLAAGIAHEINNPVGAILLHAQNALCSAGETANASLREIVDQSKRCGRIVRSVLKLAKQEETERSVCDVNLLVHQVKFLCHARAREKEASINVQISDDLPDVLINATEIEQVLVNLVENAIQSGEPGVSVVVRTDAVPGFVRVTVSDDGPGVPEAERKLIFDPFYTQHVSDGGSGLGLSIVHAIIDAHGGAIGVDFPEDGGTRIWFDLPIPQGEG